ncbi:hypothetical protein [Streptomyces sp. HGB0020]|uniref:hypothetical protein n=1 Tax=Streptomyces sp. HGB0020 TaxID=1078086 RepID=UPI00034E7B6E|nr:hypothetical protein [Streptomyces sp. HGB0020]EPD60847.1 hypothetical protein HMPREF1211_04865 [Streptomyces sp. HGB0020]
MLVEFELPGFPPPTRKPQCLGCPALVPIGFTDANRTTYTDQEYEDWLASDPVVGASGEPVFPDPRGLVVDHDEGCAYEGVPPVALWKRDLDTANRAWTKVQTAKRAAPPVPPAPGTRTVQPPASSRRVPGPPGWS